MKDSFSFYFAPFFDGDASGGTSLSAQTAAYTFAFLHRRVTSPVNGNGSFGAGFHAYTAGNADAAVRNSGSFHMVISLAEYSNLYDSKRLAGSQYITAA